MQKCIVLQQQVQNSGRGHTVVNALVTQLLQKYRQGEWLVLHHRGPQYQPGDKSRGYARHVDHRERVEQARTHAELCRFNDRWRNDQPLVVAAWHALGLGLGARGPADRKNVVRRDGRVLHRPGQPLLVVGCQRQWVGGCKVHTSRHRCITPGHDGFQAGVLNPQVQQHLRRGVAAFGLADARKSYGGLRLGDVQNVRQFMLPVLNGHGRDHDAQPGAGQVHHKLLYAIG